MAVIGIFMPLANNIEIYMLAISTQLVSVSSHFFADQLLAVFPQLLAVCNHLSCFDCIVYN